MKKNTILKANSAGQSIWLDSLSRNMINNGELAHFISLGVSGVTSNPVIFRKAISEDASYKEALREYAESFLSPEEIFEEIAIEDIRSAADMLLPVYEKTNGADGFVSIEVDPRLANKTEATIEEARRLWSRISRQNIMIKVPGTNEGITAIRSLIAEGINVNVTLLFSRDTYKLAANAYIEGLLEYARKGHSAPAHVASVASFFVSRLDTAIDAMLPEGDPRQGKAGIANARLAYHQFLDIFNCSPSSGGAFVPLHTAGAMVQRLLWASTSVKSPRYPSTMYVEALLGAKTINTLPPATIDVFLECNTMTDTITKKKEEDISLLESLEKDGISLKEVTDRLLVEGIAAFTDAYEQLMVSISAETSRIFAKEKQVSKG